MTSINRGNNTQGSAAPSLVERLWQSVTSWFSDAPQTDQAESLNQADRYQASNLAKTVTNLSRGQEKGNALELKQTLKLSDHALSRTQAIQAPHNWQSLYLNEQHPQSWSYQVQPINASIQQLEQEGRLNQTLEDAIEAFKTAPLSPPLAAQRESLIQSMLQDIAAPETIMQGNKDTCVATTAQIKLAIEDPVKYVNIMLALSGPSGQTKDSLVPKNQAGENLRLNVEALQPDTSGRSLSNRIFQAALMEYGNGGRDYDPIKDIHTTQDAQPLYRGLKGFENQILMNGLFAGKYQNQSIQQGQNRADLTQRIANATTVGIPISTGMRWGDSGHQVLVLGMDQNQVQLINPQSMGTLFQMPRGEFEKHVLSASVPTEADPGLSHNIKQPEHLADQEAYASLPGAAYLNPHEYLEQIKLPAELKNSLSNAWSKTGLQTRHFSGIQTILDRQPQDLKAAYLDTLADLSTRLDLNKIQGGQGILKLNEFMDTLWQKNGTAGLRQGHVFLQTLREAGLPTVWSQPEKAQQIIAAADTDHLNAELLKRLKD